MTIRKFPRISKEDLGGAGRPLSEGSPYPPNLPDLPRTSPKSTRPYIAKICFALYGAGALGGKFLVWAGGANALYGAASRPIGRREAFGNYALRECRDSACRRPFGVRRNAAGVCSEMTRRAVCCVSNTTFIHQSIITTNRLHLTESYTLRVILSGAASLCKDAQYN